MGTAVLQLDVVFSRNDWQMVTPELLDCEAINCTLPGIHTQISIFMWNKFPLGEQGKSEEKMTMKSSRETYAETMHKGPARE